MGLIRFSLTNPYNIYLHDTGFRNAFDETFRDMSHGCVRIGDPTSLARFALSAEPRSWSDADIQAAMNADDTHFHDLAEPLPVHMRYLTAWVDDLGRLQFRRDIYSRDKPLLALLEEAAKQAANNLNNLLGRGNPTILAERRAANTL
jgi:L,D-transpeptidase YcbB